MTATTTRDVRKLSGRFGAEVVGVDLTGELDAESVAFINNALLEHKVLGIRGQHLDDDAHQAFAAHFGGLTTAHPTVQSVEGQPNVLPVDSKPTPMLTVPSPTGNIHP